MWLYLAIFPPRVSLHALGALLAHADGPAEQMGNIPESLAWCGWAVRKWPWMLYIASYVCGPSGSRSASIDLQRDREEEAN